MEVSCQSWEQTDRSRAQQLHLHDGTEEAVIGRTFDRSNFLLPECQVGTKRIAYVRDCDAPAVYGRKDWASGSGARYLRDRNLRKAFTA
jgi:hypothetical protein